MSSQRVLSLLLLLMIFPLLLFGLKTALDLRKSAGGQLANITVDANSYRGSVPTSLWQNLVQGGEEPVDMIAPVMPQTRTLHPQLIRIDHILDFYQVYIGPDNYDFSRLDPVIATILATGARPMLSISYTPANMAQNGQVAGQPADWNQWQHLISSLARHYSVDKNISGIYYEVGNEPDLFGGWTISKDPNYLTLYAKTSQAIVSGAGSARYKIGGPATTGFYPNWFKALISTCQTNNLRLDFLSWHRYSKNINDYLTDTSTLNNLLAAYPRFTGLERLITESGPNSEPDPWYDNQLGAIHLMALNTQTVGQINRIFTFEIVDGPQVKDNNLGWGLISHSPDRPQFKPRYFALDFLNHLTGTNLSVTGNGSWVSSLAAHNHTTTQILMVNYDPKSLHAETFPLTIKNLTPGKYNLTQKYFMGTTATHSIEVSGTSYQTHVYLDPNTALLLEITPQ